MWTRLGPTGRERWLLAALVFAITWVAWSPVGFINGSGLDQSWQAGLAMATHRGIAFGRHAIFTYGPLGFLSDQPSNWFSAMTPWAFIYLLVERFALSAVVLVSARRAFGSTWWATLAAGLLAALVCTLVTELQQTAILMAVAAWVLGGHFARRRPHLLAIAIGVVSAVELMNKISIGVSFTLMSAVLLLVLPQRRGSVFAVGLGAGVIAFLAIWLILGQPLGAIPDYIHTSISVSSGYGPAMSTDSPPTDWTYTLYFVFLGAGLWAAWETTEQRPRRERIGLMVVWVLFWFFGFKESVIRVHFEQFSQGLIVGWLGFSASPGTAVRDRWFRAVAGTAALVVALIALYGGSLTKQIRPAYSVSQGIKNLNTAFSPRLRGHDILEAHISIQDAEQVDRRSLALLRGHTVSVFPDEIAAAWAYHLDWDPLPVLQSYVAYTPYLDRIDAHFLDSARAPQRILMAAATILPAQSIDGRLLGADEPETARALLCRYHAIHTGPRWAVLARGPDRCSTSTHLMFSVRAGWAKYVFIPPPPTRDSIVFARVSGAGVHGLEAVWSFLFKPGRRFAVLNHQVYYRYVSADEGDGLALRAGPGYDLPGSFALVPQAHTLAIAKIGESKHGFPITIRFYSETFHR